MGYSKLTLVRSAAGRRFSVPSIAMELPPRGAARIAQLVGIGLLGVCSLQLAGCSNSSSPAPSSYTVGGTVSGLSAGSLTLLNNEREAIAISANGPYRFKLTSSGEGQYSVVLSTQPPGQVCTVANGKGQVDYADITNVNVACVTSGEAVIYAFAGGSDGNYPDSGLTEGPDGNYYGTTGRGGAYDQGTVYKITPEGVHTVIYSFKGGTTDGANPASGLEWGNDGAFYATTTAGGAFGGGTFIRITPAGAEKLLYSFGGSGTGTNPQGLTLLDDGNFYGTTTAGGANNLGTVYKMTAGGVHTVLYSFNKGTEGRTPVAGLSSSNDGKLYGVTYYGGRNNVGTIFRIAPTGTGYETLHSFAGGNSDGSYPGTKLRQATDGNFYGTTGSGGSAGHGTIFRHNPTSGGTSVVHSFAGGATDGDTPSSRLKLGNDGYLYGVTYYGGYFDTGAFFRMTLDGTLTVLYSFAGGFDGQSPNSSLLLSANGDFYGTTVTGGASNNGTIYRIRPR